MNGHCAHLEHAAARLDDTEYLALALPDAVMARPTGFERADAMHVRIPIDGAGEAAIA